MARSTLAIAGYFGFGNAGDELILASLIEQARRETPESEIVVFSARPEETARRFTVLAVNRWQPWRWLGPLWRAERFMLGGGGLLQETSGPWNFVYYLGLVILAKSLGCRTELRAIGVDPVCFGFNRLIARTVFNQFVDHVSVRDDDSQRSLEACGVRRIIYRVPDPVFQLPRKAGVPGDGEARLAMALAPWTGRPGWDQDIALFSDRIQEELKVPVDFIVFYPDQDEAISRQASAAARHPVHVRVWDDPDALLEWIPAYALVIGMRFHALAIAALNARPFVGWGFQKKVHALCRDFGQPSWSFERGWDQESAFRQLREAWRQRESLAARYRSMLEDVRSAAPRIKEVLKIHPAAV